MVFDRGKRIIFQMNVYDRKTNETQNIIGEYVNVHIVYELNVDIHIY